MFGILVSHYHAINFQELNPSSDQLSWTKKIEAYYREHSARIVGVYGDVMNVNYMNTTFSESNGTFLPDVRKNKEERGWKR